MHIHIIKFYEDIIAETTSPLTKTLARLGIYHWYATCLISIIALVIRSETLIGVTIGNMGAFMVMYLLLTVRTNAEASKKKATAYALSSVGKTMLYMLLPLLVLSIILVLIFGKRG